MRKSLLNMYHSLKESGTSSDFPNLLANVMYKELLNRYNGFPSPWAQYTKQSDLADFKKAKRVILSEAPDLLEIEEDGNYTDAKFTDSGYDIQAKTYGRTFRVTRTTIINDDLNGIIEYPRQFGRASVRSLVKKILVPLTNSPIILCADGKSLFNDDHSNYIAATALANTAAGMAAVQACMTKMTRMKDADSNEILGVQPYAILTGATLGPIAEQLIKSAQILPVSTNGGGTYNNISGLKVIVDPLIDDQVSTTFWAVIANPADFPVIEVGFLGGKQTPDILVQGATMFSMAGGQADPYGYEFDDINYKVRHDWAVATAYYQGIVRGNG